MSAASLWHISSINYEFGEITINEYTQMSTKSAERHLPSLGDQSFRLRIQLQFMDYC
ncbi:11430_t:CDS:2, partial [Funneliformis caledonium]